MKKKEKKYKKKVHATNEKQNVKLEIKHLTAVDVEIEYLYTNTHARFNLLKIEKERMGKKV